LKKKTKTAFWKAQFLLHSNLVIHQYWKFKINFPNLTRLECHLCSNYFFPLQYIFKKGQIFYLKKCCLYNIDNNNEGFFLPTDFWTRSTWTAELGSWFSEILHSPGHPPMILLSALTWCSLLEVCCKAVVNRCLQQTVY